LTRHNSRARNDADKLFGAVSRPSVVWKSS